MLTFQQFRESREENYEEKALDMVRKGINLRKDFDFWDDFLSLCGNASGMAALLDVPVEKITGLGGRISKLRNKIGEEDSGSSKKNAKLVKTGGEL